MVFRPPGSMRSCCGRLNAAASDIAFQTGLAGVH